MGGRRRTKWWQSIGLAGYSSSLPHTVSLLARPCSLDPLGLQASAVGVIGWGVGTHTHMSESSSCWRWAGAGGPCQAPGQEPLGEGRGEWGSPICSSKQGTKPGLWGDPNTGTGFPMKAQSMSGEGEEQHFMWSRG